MQCGSCGSELAIGATRCPSCGTPTPYNATQQAPIPTSYGPPPPYGQPLNPYEQNPYTVPSPQTQPYPPPPPSRRQTKVWPIIIGILALVVLLACSISAFALFAQRTTNNTATQTVTPSPTPEEKLPYPPYNGTLVLNDPLHDNSKGYNWQSDTSVTPPSCTFANQAYHASVQAGYYYPCTAQTTDFDNFVYEVQMTITQGDCGALIFRDDSSNSNFYYLRVCQDGNSAFFIYKDKTGSTLIPGHSNTAIHTGLNQSNLVAIVAQGSTFDLYVNQQKFDSITDTTYNHGHIGMAAEGYSGDHPATEVVFNNVKVWKL